jgi:hypothetical protein
MVFTLQIVPFFASTRQRQNDTERAAMKYAVADALAIRLEDLTTRKPARFQ